MFTKNLAFAASSIETLTLPTTLTEVGSIILKESIYGSFAVNPSNPIFCAIGGHLYKKNGTSPETYSLVQVATGSTKGTFAIADDTTDILGGAVSYCLSITDIVIPASVTKIGRDATYVMKDLKNITFLGDTPPSLGFYSGMHWSNDSYCAGYGVTDTKTITVPPGCLEVYTGTEGNRTDLWKQYHDIAGYNFTD